MSTDSRDPRVQITVLPPSEAESAGHAELAAVGEPDEPPSASDFVDRAWLQQDAARRGSSLSTLGLEIHVGHPELGIDNLPTALISGGIELLEKLAAYVLAGGRLDDDQLMQLDDGLPSLIGFELDRESGLLRVVFVS